MAQNHIIRIPYVVDNIHHTLADVLNDLLSHHHQTELDVATAYFSIRGFEQLRTTLPGLRRFRLLLGDDPQSVEQIGLRPDARAYLRGELNAEPLTLATQQLVEELVRFLRRADVQVLIFLGHDPDEEGQRCFLHAKCYLLYGGRGDQSELFDHLNPLVGIFKSRFLKRLESSIDAFRISIRRALEFVKTFAEYVQDDTVLDSASFRTAMRLLEDEGEDDEQSTPRSQAETIDASTEARDFVAQLPKLNAADYDRRKLHKALSDDIDNLTEIWHDIRNITTVRDDKFRGFKGLLQEELAGQKLIVFTYYKDTARYLCGVLMRDESASWRAAIGNPHIRRIDGGNAPKDRVRIVENFAPVASGRIDVLGTEKEIDILIASDVLSEGQNLQDCGYLMNYDLHWNPTRMVQRAGILISWGQL